MHRETVYFIVGGIVETIGIILEVVSLACRFSTIGSDDYYDSNYSVYWGLFGLGLIMVIVGAVLVGTGRRMRARRLIAIYAHRYAQVQAQQHAYCVPPAQPYQGYQPPPGAGYNYVQGQQNPAPYPGQAAPPPYNQAANYPAYPGAMQSYPGEAQPLAYPSAQPQGNTPGSQDLNKF